MAEREGSKIMDTSERYIKMCEKAREIQLFRREEKHKSTGKWLIGDFWTTIFHSIDRVYVVKNCNDAWASEPEYLYSPSECMWLPRQDQLQEMVQSQYGQLDKLSPFGLCQSILEFAGKTTVSQDLMSMEQLWLAFVMKEKYSKVWNGEDWVNA